MALTIKYLTSIRGFLKARNGDGLRDWLRVEPPVPQEYLSLADELRGSYRNNDALLQLVDQCLPDEDDLPDDQGTPWPGFRAFMRDYFAYWRDVDFGDLLGAHQLLVSLTTYGIPLQPPSTPSLILAFFSSFFWTTTWAILATNSQTGVGATRLHHMHAETQL